MQDRGAGIDEGRHGPLRPAGQAALLVEEEIAAAGIADGRTVEASSSSASIRVSSQAPASQCEVGPHALQPERIGIAQEERPRGRAAAARLLDAAAGVEQLVALVGDDDLRGVVRRCEMRLDAGRRGSGR